MTMKVDLPAANTNQETAAAAASNSAALYRLMTWLSPAYPIGGYTYSHGLEAAIEAGQITDAVTTQSWLTDLIELGGGHTDAVLMAAAYDAAREGNLAELVSVAELANALAPTSELALETTAQGNAFVKVTRDAWPSTALDFLNDAWDGPVTLPVAVGIAAASHGIHKSDAVTCYLHAFAANLISAAVRAIPLGQTDGQCITARLEPAIHSAAARAQTESIETFGTSSLLSDIASMNHETQYTRLFRS